MGHDGKSPEQGIATDILVIGAGGSGLRAAIEAKERGMSVMVVSKRRKANAHTSLARHLRSQTELKRQYEITLAERARIAEDLHETILPGFAA